MNIRQIVLLFVVGVAAIWSGYTGYNRFLVPEAKAASLQNQIVSVSRASLRATVSASGSAVATRQVKLSFGTGGNLGELNVAMGDQVKAGQTLARLDQTTMVNLRNSVTQAEATLNINRINLSQTQNPYTATDLAVAAQTVRQAEINLEVARKDLDDAIAQSQLNLSLAESSVAQAAEALETANRSLAVAASDPTTNDNIRTLEDQHSYYIRAYNATLNRYENGGASKDRLDQEYSNMQLAKDKLASAREKQAVTQSNTRNEVAKAQDALSRTQSDLAKRKSGVDPDVERKRAAVTAAEINLAKTRDDLATKQAGGDTRDIEKQRNQVMSAEASLDNARQKLQGAVITAPFDGVVAIVGPNVGEPVGSNTAIVTLVDPKALRVDVSVAESDIAPLRSGQSASITFDALPNQTFPAKLSSVSPSAKVQQGVVNYTVSLALEQATGVKDGMTASSQIVHLQKDNVLVVPNRAIRTQGRNRTVQMLLPGGGTETRTITTGMSGDQTTEVTSGLQEGDRVVIPTTTTTSRGVPGGVPGGAPGGGIFTMPPPSKP